MIRRNKKLIKNKVVQVSIDCVEKLKEVYPDKFDKPNIISYSNSGVLDFHGKSASYCRGKHRKLYLEEQLKLARLGTLRYWNSEFKRFREVEENKKV